MLTTLPAVDLTRGGEWLAAPPRLARRAHPAVARCIGALRRRGAAFGRLLLEALLGCGELDAPLSRGGGSRPGLPAGRVLGRRHRGRPRCSFDGRVAREREGAKANHVRPAVLQATRRPGGPRHLRRSATPHRGAAQPSSRARCGGCGRGPRARRAQRPIRPRCSPTLPRRARRRVAVPASALAAGDGIDSSSRPPIRFVMSPPRCKCTVRSRRMASAGTAISGSEPESTR